MDSYFNTSLKSTPEPKTGTTATAARGGYALAGPHGYRLSSDELNSGLEVRSVSITTLPVDLVSELIRMRRTWGGMPDIDKRILN